jgi:hypothetical protein
MRHRQQGITFIGFLCIAALAGLIVYAGILLTPVYLTYMKVVRTMQSVATEFKDNPDEGGIRRSLDRHWNIEDINVISDRDVEIVKDNGVLKLHVAYEDKVAYLGNVSLLVNFDKSVKLE